MVTSGNPLLTCRDQGVTAGSAGWLRVRKTGIGASEIAAALGLPSAYQSPLSLYMLKRGELDDEVDNVAMEWGRRQEAVILERFIQGHPEFRTHDPLTDRLYRSTHRHWQMATPDAVVFDTRHGFHQDTKDEDTPRTRWGDPVVVQVKTAYSRHGWGTEGTDEIPVHYRAQVLQEMDVVGAKVAWVPVLFHGNDYREYRLRRHPKDIHILRVRGAEFWARIEEANPPDADGHSATTKALAGTFLDPGTTVQVPRDLVHKLERVKRLQKRTDALRARVENELRAAMGEAEKAMCGSAIVASRTTYTQRQFRTADFREAHPLLASEFTENVQRVRFTSTEKELES